MERDLLADYRALRASGEIGPALRLAGEQLGTLPAGKLGMLGKMLEKDIPAAHPDLVPLEILLLGQCTTTYLAAPLVAWAWSLGLHVVVQHGEYDQVMQELQSRQQGPDMVVLLPWQQRLVAKDSRSLAERVDDEVQFFKQAWTEVARLKSKLIQISHDWMGTGPLGYSLSGCGGGEIGLVRAANTAIREILPNGAFWVDLESISGWLGRNVFYDERNYFWLKQPFSPDGLSQLGRHLAAAIRSLNRGRKKVLVLDLDNTLWGGVVGELGPHGISVGGIGEGEAYAAFQLYAKGLKASGVLLAVASKNNDADAREPFSVNEQMPLRLDDFVAFHASWDPKPAALQRMAIDLNLGLDSFVFFDDNPVEREQMRASLPEVTVVEVPADPAQYIRALQESLAFEVSGLTAEDKERTVSYQQEVARRHSAEAAGSAGDYLSSLNMKAEVQPITDANLQRVVDLITKTNQFNLTTRRHSAEFVAAMAGAARSVCFAVKLTDKFGDYGLISVLLGREVIPGTLGVDTWLMSCRAMGRTVEHFAMNHLASSARQLGYETISASYLPTTKNQAVQGLLAGFGFQAVVGSENESQLSVETYFPLPTSVS